MYQYLPINVEDFTPFYMDTSIFQKLLTNGVEIEDVIDNLKSCTVFGAFDEDRNFLGMLSVNPLENNGVEVHAYLLPSERNSSKGVLKGFMGLLFNDFNVSMIGTSVTSDFQYIVRFLSMLNFTVVKVDKGVVEKPTGVYDISYLSISKEEYNGFSI